MMKYFAILCLCLAVGIVLAQAEETTTDKRVERDLNMPEMPNGAGFPTDMMTDFAGKIADGAQQVFKGMQDMIPGAGSTGFGASRRRRSPQQNSQPPRPPKTQG